MSSSLVSVTIWHLPLTGQESRLCKQESDEQRSQVRLLPAFQPENVGSSPAGVTISASSNGRTLVSASKKATSAVRKLTGCLLLTPAM